MPTRDMTRWETSICKVVSDGEAEEIVVRGRKLSDLIGEISFAEVMFLTLRSDLPTKARVLDALLVASIEYGIAPPSMIARCFASYGTSIQAAVGGGVLAFGDRMGGLGEQMARMMVEEVAGAGLDAAADDETLARLADDMVAAVQAQGERLPGFGIPLHGADPRARQVLAVARAGGTHGLYCRLAEALARRRGGRGVPMNLDGVSACVILDLGFDWRATRFFLSTPRTVSFAAHYLEEQDQDTTLRHLPADQISYRGPEPE